MNLILHFFLDQKQKPWIVPCLFIIWSICIFSETEHVPQPLILSLFFLVKSLAYMFYKWYWFAFFIQHKDPVWSSDAEPPFGSRKRNEKAYARSAKKYHQDKIRSGLFPFPFLLFIIFSQLAIVQCDFLASHKRMDSWLHEMIR